MLVLAYALVALALPGAASADRVFLANRFPPPLVKPGEELPSPLLPEDALTGFETPAKSFQDACGLAVRTDGRIYVSDHDHDVIDSFGSNGRYLNQIDDLDPLSGPCGLAVGSGGGLYVNDYHRGVIRYQEGSATTIDPGPATGIAVDASNRIYVTHPTFVAVYEPNGAPVLDESLEPLHIGGAGVLGDAYGAAVSGFGTTFGDLYVADAADDTVKVFDPATDKDNPVTVIDGSLGPQQGFRNLRDSSLAIDQSNGNLLVVDQLVGHAEEPPVVVDEFSPEGNFRGQLPHAISGGEPTGIALNPISHQVYVTTGRRQDSGVYAFGPATPGYALLVSKAGTGQGVVTSTPADIACPASCPAGEAEFDVGWTVTLSAEPAPHSAFSGWSVSSDPSACPDTGPCQVQMNVDTEVSATFTAIPQQALTVSREGSGQGTVTSSPEGIDCGSACSAGFDEGSTVTLTATPALHSHLGGWSVAGDPTACQGSGPCEVPMDQATQVSADFEPNPDRTLSVSVSGQGTVRSAPAGIDCPSTCAGAFAEGAQVSLVAEPAPGYELLSWSGACSGKRGCFVRMDGDRSVSATFVPIEDALAVSVIGAGAGAVTDPAAGIDCGLTCAGIYRRGSVLNLTAKAETGSRFIGFSGCDAVSGATCTVTVTEAKTVTALFAEAPEIFVRRVQVRGARATLTVSVPAPGLLEASGRGLTSAKARARSEGVVILHVSLTAKGRRSLRRAKEGKLSLLVALRFTSADGSRTKAKKLITFRRRGRGAR